MASKLDTSFYKSVYPDLAHMSTKELPEHWQIYGIK